MILYLNHFNKIVKNIKIIIIIFLMSLYLYFFCILIEQMRNTNIYP